ncbi:MAG: Ku protein, partial [Oscillospiraceae bacterium]|nr:Ku protein [Oscillospiraceae bacterium]
MPAIKSAISFGLVHIPVALHTAAASEDVRFNQLHKGTGERIRYKKTCPSCKADVTQTDIVRGFEYEKDKYVVITDADIEKIKTKQEKIMQIQCFVDLSEVSPVYFDKTYNASPEKGGEKAFELL